MQSSLPSSLILHWGYQKNLTCGWLRPQEPEGGRVLPSWARLSGCAGDAAGAPQTALVLGGGTVVCSKGPDKLQADGKKTELIKDKQMSLSIFKRYMYSSNHASWLQVRDVGVFGGEQQGEVVARSTSCQPVLPSTATGGELWAVMGSGPTGLGPPAPGPPALAAWAWPTGSGSVGMPRWQGCGQKGGSCGFVFLSGSSEDRSKHFLHQALNVQGSDLISCSFTC